jgi:serine/threonine protein kinase
LDADADVNAKVADFGLAQRVDPAMTDIQGTWQWLPPEVLKIDFHFSKKILR